MYTHNRLRFPSRQSSGGGGGKYWILVVLLRDRKCRFWSQFSFNIFAAKASLRVVRKELSTAISRKVVAKRCTRKSQKVLWF